MTHTQRKAIGAGEGCLKLGPCLQPSKIPGYPPRGSPNSLTCYTGPGPLCAAPLPHQDDPSILGSHCMCRSKEIIVYLQVSQLHTALRPLDFCTRYSLCLEYPSLQDGSLSILFPGKPPGPPFICPLPPQKRLHAPAV